MALTWKKCRNVFLKRFLSQVIQAVTFLSPNVGGHLTICKGSRELTIPKKSPTTFSTNVFCHNSDLPKVASSSKLRWLSMTWQTLQGSSPKKNTVEFVEKNMFSGSKVANFFCGDGRRCLPPLMTGILISWGPINPYGIGLMSFIPYYMEMSWELIDPIALI